MPKMPKRPKKLENPKNKCQKTIKRQKYKQAKKQKCKKITKEGRKTQNEARSNQLVRNPMEANVARFAEKKNKRRSKNPEIAQENQKHPRKAPKKSQNCQY